MEVTGSPSVVRSASPQQPRAAEVCAALTRRAEQALRELHATHHAYAADRGQRQHGALSLAVAQAQQVLQALERVRDERERARREMPQPQPRPAPASAGRAPGASPPPPVTTTTLEDMQLHARMGKVRIDLRRVLPRAVAMVEDSDGAGNGTSASGQSAANTAAALRSLLHTRSMLSVELRKMDAAVHGLSGSSESLAVLHQSLQDVHSSMEAAQRLVRSLLTIQSRDGALLRVSATLFVLVVLYVLAHRVLRFFPATVYVAVGPG
ncbi:Sec20 [Novymonas esmeraldas]|uniref:Sec20 n=1 Tax=Novymonas esmeraldas TaxID=1808958 RepID=A0AAW0F5V7_9TRYP